jgi:hypothetical protein
MYHNSRHSVSEVLESNLLYIRLDTYQNFRHSVAQYIAYENDGRDDHVG